MVLIDLRQATIDGQTRRGLIMHHQAEASYREGHPPPWVSDELMARIDKLLHNTDADGLGRGAMLRDYRDDALTNGKLYWGAIEPVIDRRHEEPVRDIRWLVLVQEPVSR